MLPDKSEEYAITMDAGFGTAEADPTLQDGWNLTGLTGKAHSKTAENLTAVASLVKSIAPGAGVLAFKPGAAAGGTKTVIQNCSGFYRLKFDESGNVSGFKQVPLPTSIVVVSTTPPPKPADAAKACGKPSQPPCAQ
ncbi:hypothetical protein [Tardiphaga sp.]|uniref:hypothetical protein n=1 Tax=Tardiphaga sp. TaxID=1926292 RepID=UPI00352B7909